MEPEILHSWNVTPREASAIQEGLKDRICLAPMAGRIRWVGGADVSYARGEDRLFGAMVVLSFPDLVLVDQAWETGRVAFPYIPGLLGFRECPILLEVARRIHQPPDVWIFDGQGIAHPRGVGLASHLGLLLGSPSVGCAKKRLLGFHGEVGPGRGDFELLAWEGRTVGAVVRTRTGIKPVYVSPGFRIDLEGAVRLVLETTGRYRIPEPLRQAHLLSKRIREEGNNSGVPRSVCR
ncbi:MAG: endonuclease V [Deltaproteobacteria bacterium]|nr:endonuclease V [Deltaproteobacteria bacterium]MBW2120872.1 endonuclease V [Deltaproteobacteria bacterium]